MKRLDYDLKIIALEQENRTLEKVVEKLLRAVAGGNIDHQCSCGKDCGKSADSGLVPGNWYIVELWKYACSDNCDPEYIENEYAAAQYREDGNFYIDDMPVSVHGYVVPFAAEK